jgi:hypothetical protein
VPVRLQEQTPSRTKIENSINFLKVWKCENLIKFFKSVNERYARIFGDFPAKNTVFSLYIYGSGQT